MGKSRHVLILFFITATVGVAVVEGQDSQVSGQIRDTTQAAIPAATVALTRTENGDQREIVSTTNGDYSFPLVLPGHCELKVEKEGFATQTRTGITVETGANQYGERHTKSRVETANG